MGLPQYRWLKPTAKGIQELALSHRNSHVYIGFKPRVNHGVVSLPLVKTNGKKQKVKSERRKTKHK
jgi:hypothetical protein